MLTSWISLGKEIVIPPLPLVNFKQEGKRITMGAGGLASKALKRELESNRCLPAPSFSLPVEFWQFLQIQEGRVPFDPAQIKLINQLL